MTWFTRIRDGITTSTQDKKEIKEGLWFKCPKCKKIFPIEDHEKNMWVCECDYHDRITAVQYTSILCDDGTIKELNANLVSVDKLGFVDSKPYPKRLDAAVKKMNANEAILTVSSKMEGLDVVFCIMDFGFIGGSMGSVVGEKIARAIEYSIKNKFPLIIISKSGGARMQEAAFSLMQMAKVSTYLGLLADAKLPYISLLTDPTSGGVTASFGMLGDLNIAEPGSLIGFAGPRVIRDTIGRDLPEGFQSAEFVLEHGFLDHIVPRKEMKSTIAKFLRMFAS